MTASCTDNSFTAVIELLIAIKAIIAIYYNE